MSPRDDLDDFEPVKPGPPPRDPREPRSAPPRAARRGPSRPAQEPSALKAIVVGGLCRVCRVYGEAYCPGCGQFFCDEHKRVTMKLVDHHASEHRAPVT